MILPLLLSLVGARHYTIDSLALASLLPDSSYVVARRKTDSVKARDTVKAPPVRVRSWRVSLRLVETDLSQAGKLGVELPTSWGFTLSPSRGLSGLTVGELTTALDLMFQRGAASVLASPDLVVSDGETGTLDASDVHYVQSSTVLANGAGTTSYQAFSSGLQVSFRPQSVSDSLDSLDFALTCSYSFPSDSREPPSLSSRSVSTKFRLVAGDSVAVSGLRQRRRVRASGLLWWSWEWHDVELSVVAIIRRF